MFADPVQPPPFGLADGSTPPRVVLLEDHVIVRESLEGVLTQAGIEVVAEFGDGGAFLRALPGLSFEVALLDIMLEPRGSSSPLDGLAVLKAMKQQRPAARAVVLSAVRTPGIHEEAFQRGASAFLPKLEVNRVRLVETVLRVANGELVGVDGIERAATRREALGALEEVDGRLTGREREVLAYIAIGADNLKIAGHLEITERTVRAHVSALYRKLERENRTELALLARDMGLLPPRQD